MKQTQSFDERLEFLREGGKIHKAVREWIKPQLVPGIKLVDVADSIENKVRELTNYDQEKPLMAGSGFPTGVSVNDCAAHWTPNPVKGDLEKVLGPDDVLKIDFGVQIQGNIIDAAFTHTFNPKYDKLVEAAYEATQAATKEAGADAILGQIGKTIQEIIGSYEVELDGKTYPLKPLSDLCGHNIGLYRIHDDKAIPNVSVPSYNTRMGANEIYAVETFPSTGRGRTKSDHDNNSHYMINYQLPGWENLKGKKEGKELLKRIKKNYHSLAFCKRWLASPETSDEVQKGLDWLVNKKIITPYPPLYDIKGSYVAQFEQTIAVKETGVEILS